MPPTGVPIPVHVNFKGISYDSATGQWTIPSGAPDWSVPATVAVASGNNLLTWTLTASHVPAGFTPAFDSSSGRVRCGLARRQPLDGGRHHDPGDRRLHGRAKQR